jgi:hypothetical protein
MNITWHNICPITYKKEKMFTILVVTVLGVLLVDVLRVLTRILILSLIISVGGVLFFLLI